MLVESRQPYTDPSPPASAYPQLAIKPFNYCLIILGNNLALHLHGGGQLAGFHGPLLGQEHRFLHLLPLRKALVILLQQVVVELNYLLIFDQLRVRASRYSILVGPVLSTRQTPG